MSAYRFCRTDDIGLLVEALNRCWRPYFPDEPPVTPAVFKRWIRDLQIWCSSCMVAFSGADPIAVLIGAKRTSGTLVYKLAVHPDHRRQGHGRHLLESLGAKLAILGPPRILAEVPESLVPARELFSACGYVEEAVLTDYVWDDGHDDRRTEHGPVHGNGLDASQPGVPGRMVIPVNVDDLAANGLLPAGDSDRCWECSVETLTARKADIAGLAVASDERIEACILYSMPAGGSGRPAEIAWLRSFVEDGGARLGYLLCRLRAAGITAFMLPKVHPREFSTGFLEALGLRATGTHRLCVASGRRV